MLPGTNLLFFRKGEHNYGTNHEYKTHNYYSEKNNAIMQLTAWQKKGKYFLASNRIRGNDFELGPIIETLQYIDVDKCYYDEKINSWNG